MSECFPYAAFTQEKSHLHGKYYIRSVRYTFEEHDLLPMRHENFGEDKVKALEICVRL